MSSTGTRTSTFTITEARYVGAKIGTDLRLLNSLYGEPALAWIDKHTEEAALLLRDGYLGTVSYGFRDRTTNEWKLRLRYTATAGTGFDLAIAIAMLTTAGIVPAAALDGCVFTAELGLDGSLRPVRGILPALHAARHAGYTRAVVATANAAEAVMVVGLTVVPCSDLRTVLARLRGESFPHQPGIPAAGPPAAPGGPPGASLAVPRGGCSP